MAESKKNDEPRVEYEDIPEIVPGVFVDPGEAVYIVDDQGEVVSWDAKEWEEDQNAVTATVNACILAAVQGPESVRANLIDKGETLRELLYQTYLKNKNAK